MCDMRFAIRDLPFAPCPPPPAHPTSSISTSCIFAPPALATTTIPHCTNIGVFNVNPTFVSQTDAVRPALAFVSSRNNFLPVSAFNSGERTLQLLVMDWDGTNARQIGYLNQSMALHPFQLLDGRLM